LVAKETKKFTSRLAFSRSDSSGHFEELRLEVGLRPNFAWLSLTFFEEGSGLKSERRPGEDGRTNYGLNFGGATKNAEIKVNVWNIRY